jgi:hypothetical protein
MKAAILILSVFLVAGMIPFGLASLPQVLLPSGVVLAVPAGTKLHLGDKWVYPQTVDMLITKWNESSWINYTVSGIGTQQIDYGSEPVAVYIDGSHHGKGDGWTYTSTTATVSSALSAVSLCYDLTVPVVPSSYVPTLPQTGSAQTVHFIVTMQDKPVEGCQIRVYDNATNEYVLNVITGASGKVDVQLAAGVYSYEAEYKGKHGKDSWLHIEEETIRITFGQFTTTGTGTVERSRVIQYAVGGVVIVIAVFALFTVKKKMVG